MYLTSLEPSPWISGSLDLALPVPAMSPWASQWAKNVTLCKVYHHKVIYLRCLAWHLTIHVHAQGPDPSFSFLSKDTEFPPILSSLWCLLSPFTSVLMMSARALAVIGGGTKSTVNTLVVCWALCQELSIHTIWGTRRSHSEATTVVPILKMRRLKPREIQWPAQGHTVCRLRLHMFVLCCCFLSSSTMH